MVRVLAGGAVMRAALVIALLASLGIAIAALTHALARIQVLA